MFSSQDSGLKATIFGHNQAAVVYHMEILHFEQDT